LQSSIRNIITLINQSIEGIFKGGKIYGIATLVEREGKGQPVVDETPVSYDDIFAFQLYHRLGNVGITYKPGYGNTRTTVNTFSVSAIVFNNEQITKLKQDEIAMILQSVLAALNITSVLILPTQIILNSQQVFATEYKGVPYSLNEYQSLMQINYTVEITFKGNCFDLCPEDFNKCSGTN
jgi:hypothetical protein